jgi:hypothetical protein
MNGECCFLAMRKINVLFTFIIMQGNAKYIFEKGRRHPLNNCVFGRNVTGSSNKTLVLQGFQAVLKVFL